MIDCVIRVIEPPLKLALRLYRRIHHRTTPRRPQSAAIYHFATGGDDDKPDQPARRLAA